MSLDKNVKDVINKAHRISMEAAELILNRVDEEIESEDDKAPMMVAVVSMLAGKSLAALSKAYGIPYNILLQGIKIEFEGSIDSINESLISLN